MVYMNGLDGILFFYNMCVCLNQVWLSLHFIKSKWGRGGQNMTDGKLNKEEKKAEKARKKEEKLAKKLEEKQAKDNRKQEKEAAKKSEGSN
jgi:hypothetical protein